MLVFPNAKINLGLRILSKRHDGYHNIETCFYPIDWCDALEMVIAPAFNFTQSGLSIDGDTKNNLCIKAYQLMQQSYALPPVHMHLHKVIPFGAGLGGGSADAAFTLKALNEIFKLDLSDDTLKNHAAVLGSDCAFFIDNKPAVGEGRGDELHAVDISLKGKFLAVIKPDVMVSTAQAYAGVIPSQANNSLTDILQKPIAQWKQHLVNDFEISVFERHSEIKQIKEKLYAAGAIYAAMSGSGAAVFGIFNQEIEMQPFNVYAHWSGFAKV
jgi:4-diphosphocytidyl-2-C-methyl-D-erythritol kinase